MSFVYRRGNKWAVGYKDERGRQRQLVTTARTKTEAQRMADDLERKAERVRLGLEKVAPVRLRFGELARRYLSTAAKQQRSYATIKQRVEQHILPVLEAKWLDEVTPADIERLLAQKQEEGYAPQTREHLRVHLQAIFAFAIEREKVLTGENPAAVVGEVEVPETDPVHVPDSWVPIIIANVHERSRELFATAVYTGLRKGELFGLPKAAYDRQRRLLTVAKSHGATTKAAKVRYVPVPLELVGHLEAQLARPEVQKSEYLFPDTSGGRRGAKEDLAGLFKSALRRAGLVEEWVHVCRRCKAKGTPHEEKHADDAPRKCPKCGMQLWPRGVAGHFTFKHLRSTYGTYAAEHTSDIRFVQATLGHGDVKVTEKHYAKVRAARLVEQADKIRFGADAGLTAQPPQTVGAEPTPGNPESIPPHIAARSRGLEPLTSGVTGRPESVGPSRPESSSVVSAGTSAGAESSTVGGIGLHSPTHTYPQLTAGLLTVAEVAQALRVSSSTVYALIRDGRLPAVQVGASKRIRPADLEAFIAHT